MDKKPVIVFDESVKMEIIHALGFKLDNQSRLVTQDGKVVTTQDFESIRADEFGGVLQGSKIAIKNKDSELVRYFSGKY